MRVFGKDSTKKTASSHKQPTKKTKMPVWLSPVEYFLGKERVASSNLATGFRGAKPLKFI